MHRILMLRSHAAHARFLAECEEGYLGEIPRQKDIPSPYAYSPSHLVLEHAGVPVIIVETSHRRYEVFEVDRSAILPAGTVEGLLEKGVRP